MNLSIEQWNVINESDWSELVRTTYGRPYRLQQQDDCLENGSLVFISTDNEFEDDFENETIPEVVSNTERGVSFKAWLERDPDKKIQSKGGYDPTALWWERNFYPEVNMIAVDLCKRGLLPAGDYVIYVSW